MCLGNLKSTYLGVALVATTRGDLPKTSLQIITNLCPFVILLETKLLLPFQ